MSKYGVALLTNDDACYELLRIGCLYLVGILVGLLEGSYVGLTVKVFDGDLLVNRVGVGAV